jgi:hypothetical protein
MRSEFYSAINTALLAKNNLADLIRHEKQKALRKN